MAVESKVFGMMNLTPEQMLNYLPPDDEQAHVEDLVNKSKEGSLTEVERVELDYFVQLEHLLQLMRSRAAKVLASQRAA